ncbi:acyltransferase [Uliginosibacterium sp. H3]|uniref:Acyltransferase n=1 Tax=Uliginosibacterium silvisoli TaxID=3114758 RepID=A0ABU6K7G7_9RHOO|nr:acyltransferase [Uliginosibacterium sp. H3]
MTNLHPPLSAASTARNEAIDLLRAIGLVLVMLAHVSPPEWLFQLRNFDVPMLVIAAGMSFALSSAVTQWGAYVWKRFKRLVIPVWVFLAGYFLVLHALNGSAAPDTHTMLSSFFLGSGIGFVWVIRVFLLVALVAPLIAHVDASLPDNRQWLIYWLGLYALSAALLWSISLLVAGTPAARVELITHYLLPYAFVFWLGLRAGRLPDSLLLAIALASAAICGGLALWHAGLVGSFVQTQEFKYPPALYYLSYALPLSIASWFAARPLARYAATQPRLHALVSFVGQNSIWIYLWHIPVVMAFDGTGTAPWYLILIACLLWSVAITALQVQLVNRLLLPRVGPARLRADLRMVLTG